MNLNSWIVVLIILFYNFNDNEYDLYDFVYNYLFKIIF